MKIHRVSALLSGLALLVSLIAGGRVALAQSPSITLDWTAPGDDGNVGTATSYEMRWATTRPDTTSATTFNSWWATATIVTGLPNPQIAGTSQSVTVTPVGGFASGRTYYFVMRTADEVPNWSGYSNVAWKAIIDLVPPAAVTDLRVR
jgi:hypothetical protein